MASVINTVLSLKVKNFIPYYIKDVEILAQYLDKLQIFDFSTELSTFYPHFS